MINPFYKKFAKLVVHYSIEVKKGDKVLIEGLSIAKELFQALFLEILNAGGHPIAMPTLDGID
ncbi:MAG: aminopeptidase, partial [Promethearchaeota archaeon]